MAFLGPNRSGIAQLKDGVTLTVEGGQCLYGSNEAPINAHCHFVNEGGQVLLVYDTPGGDNKPSRHPTPKIVFVYYADSGLLVGPELVSVIFTKQ